jgi:hypothetical protein
MFGLKPPIKPLKEFHASYLLVKGIKGVVLFIALPHFRKIGPSRFSLDVPK